MGPVTEAVDELRSDFVVHVSGPGVHARALPDAEGLFALKVPAGSYEIRVRRPDFRRSVPRDQMYAILAIEPLPLTPRPSQWRTEVSGQWPHKSDWSRPNT